ncbi:MAG: 2-C-methyl-D-erythritol 4-phosphate cytidylyltransferase [Armatimonadetes bacterium]|nr:2-C-methyl-D-erythritol 4-phosphate cytidylyltransferase [Armatimonadota bacterium]
MTGTSALIPAAGQGKRFGNTDSKILAPLCGQPVICHTLRAFDECESVDSIVLVVNPHDRDAVEALVSRHHCQKVTAIIDGGAERQESVWAGLKAMPQTVQWVVIHDGARPLVTPGLIEAVLEAAEDWGAAIAAVPETDTVKRIAEGRFVSETLPRKSLMRAQTPQVFDREILLEAFEKARTEGYVGTDDASLVERMDRPVAVVEGPPDNIKVTRPEDLWIAEMLLQRRWPGP